MTSLNKKAVLIIIISFLLCSCFQSGTTGSTRIMNPALINNIEPGSTTMARVKDLLGPPNERLRNSAKEETWKYYHTRYSMGPVTWETLTDIVEIQFSQDGIVKEVKKGYMDQEGTGFSTQTTAKERK